MENDCIFCAIAQRHTEAYVVFENDDVIAFLDYRPVFEGHTLVLPKIHMVTLYDLPENTITSLFTQVQKVGKAIESAMQAEGTFVGMNNVISQSVPHFHIHIIPRNRKDGLRGFFWPRKHFSEIEMQNTQKKIIQSLKKQ